MYSGKRNELGKELLPCRALFHFYYLESGKAEA
jgi:hypothetical protein